MGIFSKKIKPFIVGVGGRSCSGKSEVTRYLVSKHPDNLVRVPADRFFKVFNTKELDATDGWESPSSIRWDRLIYSVKKLRNGESTHIPSKGWTEKFDQLISHKKIVLVEGYLIYTNEELVKLIDKKIWVDISDLNILYRRVKRGGNIDYVMNKVIPISKRFEEKQKKVADIIIDGNKSKEEVLNWLKKHLKI